MSVHLRSKENICNQSFKLGYYEYAQQLLIDFNQLDPNTNCSVGDNYEEDLDMACVKLCNTIPFFCLLSPPPSPHVGPCLHNGRKRRRICHRG